MERRVVLRVGEIPYMDLRVNELKQLLSFIEFRLKILFPQHVKSRKKADLVDFIRDLVTAEYNLERKDSYTDIISKFASLMSYKTGGYYKFTHYLWSDGTESEIYPNDFPESQEYDRLGLIRDSFHGYNGANSGLIPTNPNIQMRGPSGILLPPINSASGNLQTYNQPQQLHGYNQQRVVTTTQQLMNIGAYNGPGGIARNSNNYNQNNWKINHNNNLAKPFATFEKLRFIESPYYNIENVKGKPQLCIESRLSTKSIKWLLYLDDKEVGLLKKEIEKEKYKLYLYTCSVESANSSYLSGSLGARIEYPATMSILVNKKPVTTPKNISKKAQLQPIDITDSLKSIPNESNVVELFYTCGKKMVAIIYLAKVYTAEQTLERLRKDNFHTKESVLEKMKKSSLDDDIVATRSVLSLTCPLGQCRISVPIRSEKCKHNQCFDGYTFFQMNMLAPTWECPVCSLSVGSYKSLFVDGYFEELLKIAPSKMTQINIEPDGTYNLDKEKDSGFGNSSTPLSEKRSGSLLSKKSSNNNINSDSFQILSSSDEGDDDVNIKNTDFGISIDSAGNNSENLIGGSSPTTTMHIGGTTIGSLGGSNSARAGRIQDYFQASGKKRKRASGGETRNLVVPRVGIFDNNRTNSTSRNSSTLNRSNNQAGDGPRTVNSFTNNNVIDLTIDSEPEDAQPRAIYNNNPPSEISETELDGFDWNSIEPTSESTISVPPSTSIGTTNNVLSDGRSKTAPDSNTSIPGSVVFRSTFQVSNSGSVPHSKDTTPNLTTGSKTRLNGNDQQQQAGALVRVNEGSGFSSDDGYRLYYSGPNTENQNSGEDTCLPDNNTVIDSVPSLESGGTELTLYSGSTIGENQLLNGNELSVTNTEKSIMAVSSILNKDKSIDRNPTPIGLDQQPQIYQNDVDRNSNVGSDVDIDGELLATVDQVESDYLSQSQPQQERQEQQELAT
ncbi:hypothetical protein BB559_005195 [Furculomyces boomerangus]|uniref:SP-RING-type domain-containing protein n=1 Tax=Furculomyces boomerangus TaxID=61424 RepID=A0A2T9YA43_9FUNG|nr:hypothetical protein BB559_005195 [Furculomyces boomerangus]